MEEAVRTRVLSRRWKCLWMYYTGCLDFEIWSLSKHYLVPEGPVIYREWLVTWVNTVLKAYRGETVDELRIHSILEDPFYEFDVDGWISFARKKHVQKLSHDLGDWVLSGWLYKFPKICFTSNFDSLRFLSLKGVDGSDMEYVFSTCPLLEGLKLVEVCSLKRNFRVSGSSLMLKFLELESCAIDQLEVFAPNLTTLRCDQNGMRAVLLETQKLVLLSLTGMHIEDYRVLQGGVPSRDPDLLYKTLFISIPSRL